MKLLQYCFFGLLCIVLMGTFGLIHIKAAQPNASQNAYMMGIWLFYYACLPFLFFKANNNIPSLKVKDLNHLWKVTIRIYIYRYKLHISLSILAKKKYNMPFTHDLKTLIFIDFM